MSRHRNIRRPNYDDEYDDVYGSQNASVEERDMCVSPGTMAQFTFYRRDSDGDNNSRAQMDSITESDDIIQDIDLVMDEMEIDDTVAAVPVRQLAAQSKSELTTCSSLRDVVQKQSELQDMIEADHLLVPLLASKKRTRIRVSTSCGSETFRSFRNVTKKEENDWFVPVDEFMSNYAHSQSYKFDFTEPPVRFALSAKVKGKIPTPRNEVDADALVSRRGQRMDFGPTMKNDVPVKLTDEAMNAIEPPADGRKAKAVNPKTQQLITRDSSPAPKSAPASPSVQRDKNVNKTVSAEVVRAEYEKERMNSKPHINLVVIGHVDAGKSTLMGRLLCDLGYVSQKAMHRNETDSRKTGKASFLYAWVLDETEEERSRGITMDVAQSRFETSNRRVTILDAPGHKDFIPNMITGAAQADVALLVVDATSGEFEAGFDAGGQTREHTMLVRSLGVAQLAVVVNKLDNVQWNRSRYDEIVNKLKLFLKQTGFREADVTFVPCSGLTGENLATKSTQPLLNAWYSGPCLIDVIDNFRPPERLVTKPVRISIADIFKSQVSGVCISARIDAGAVSVGHKLVILPAGEVCSVKSILIDDQPQNQAFAGDNVVIILLSCDPNNMSVGNVMCDPSSPCPVTSKFEARVVVFSSTQLPLTKGLPVVIHYGNSSEQAVVKKLVSQLNRSTGEVQKKNPRCLTKNSSGVLVIEVAKPICVEKYSENKDLGRFMLRYAGNTIAAGLIVSLF